MYVGERITSHRNDGLVFDVRDEGPPDGPVVVLLHGFPQRASSWDGVVPHLHEAGYRTVAPDLRGYSRGARPRGRASYRMSALVGDVVTLVAAVGDGPVHLVGHDWGAAVAWSTAAARPDLVRSLTSVSVPHPEAFVRSLRRADQLKKSWYMFFFQLPWLPERMLGRREFAEREMSKGGMPPAAVARLWPEIVLDGALPGGLGYYRGIPYAAPAAMRSAVRVPTTHVWSDGDVALDRHGAELTASYVDASYRLEVLPGVSHWIPDEVPERLAAIILERIGPQGVA